MIKIGKQKSFLKLLIVLLITSIIWFFAVLEMLYNTIYDNNSQLYLFNYGTQLKFVYGIGTVLIVVYTLIIVDKSSTNNRNFN